MMRIVFLLIATLLSGADRLAAQEQVEARGVKSEVNDKFKVRATEFTFAPGALLGAHHHVGPGIRYIISDELTFTEGGVSTTYKAGDYFYETGNIVHTAENKT